MTPEHIEYVKKLMKIGEDLGFYVADGKKLGKMYHMGSPDCVWYYNCEGKEPLMKIAKGERCEKTNCKIKHGNGKFLPFIAFEVADSEKEKGLRGSLMSLQLTNASAGVIVLVGTAAKYKSYLNKLVGRYSSARIRIWMEKDVNKLYNEIVKIDPTCSSCQ